ncbi:MAG: TonB-dependent receptor [Alphaproteobacteria bacterium]|nr:MAG: TonB-dependent receptor [Alphaproteobacteria bacterium]
MIAGMTLATPAFAQDTPPAAPADDATPPAGVQTQESAGPAEETSSGDIVITGTLIKNPNLTSSAPVTTVGQDEMQLRQSNVAEEVLREIPGAVPSIGSQVNNGNGGASYVNLRGLGSTRNIVLLDGVRIVPGDLSGRVDLNNIPLALVDRVDVLTGGASSTYGADAVGGVVNFITRSDFSGMELNASEQITGKGDGNFFRADLTVGANFDDGRGNAVISLGYQDSDPVYFGDRKFSQLTLESYDEFFVAGQGSSTTTPARLDIGGGFAARQITSGGGLGPYTTAFNFNPYNVFQVPFERFNMYGAGHYEVTDGIEVYARGLFSNNTIDTIIAPSGVFGSSVNVPISNPFLTASQRASLCAISNVFDPTTKTSFQGSSDPTKPNFGPSLTAAQCAAAAAATSPTDPNYREFVFGLRRRTPEVGPRVSDYNTQIFDFRAGIRGSITDNIGFDLFGSYGQSKNTQTIKGYVLLSRVRDALRATNVNSCLSGNAGCVPLNIFGTTGSISPEMVDYINDESTSTVQTTLAQARGVINGDFGVTSPFATDPIGFAVGAEYRKYTATQRSDILAKTPGELGGAGGAQPDVNGAFDVYEGFGELIVPLVSDRALFHSLSLEAGIRRSHYTVDAPGTPKFNTTTWKVGAQWEPVVGVKLRGSYNRAVRAPNIGELFFPVTTGLTNLGTDPCAGAAPVGNAALRDVCIFQGAPAATIGAINNPTAGQANTTTGGNPFLKPEKASSWTVGAVLQPNDLVRGLTITIDYYNIKIDGASGSPTPGDIINACFDSPSVTNEACAQIRRNPITGGLDGDPATTQGLLANLTNLGTLETDGVDAGLNYRTNLPFLGARLNWSFNGNYTHDSKFRASPTSINRECTGFYSPNCGSIQPKFQFQQRTTLSFGSVDVSLLWRYIHGVDFEHQQQLEDEQAADAANHDSHGVLLPPAKQPCPDFAGADAGGCVVDPRFRSINAKHYFDLSTRVGVTDNFDFTITVQNLFDKKPPVVGGTVGSTTYNGGNTYPSTYDPLGRRFAVGARLKF